MSDLRHLHEAAALLVRAFEVETEEEDDRPRLDAETGFEAAVVRIAEEVREIEGLVGVLKERGDEIDDRRRRLQARAQRYRTALLQALERAGVKKLAAAELTVARTAVPPKALVIEPGLLPADLWRQKPPEPDLIEIRRRLKAGEAVPGVELGNGGETITITV